jgi:hypothetical protein
MHMQQMHNAQNWAAKAKQFHFFLYGAALIALLLAAPGWAQHPTISAVTTATPWSVPVTVTLSSSRDSVTFGAQTGATNGLDQGIDLPNPPPPPSGGIDAYFEISHPLFPKLSKDIRSDQDSSIAWKFVITGTSGQSGTIIWNASAFPVGNPARAILQIKQGSTVLANMLTQSSLNFAGDQNLDIVCFSTAKVAVDMRQSEAAPESFLLSNYPNPFSSTTTLEIRLPTARPIVVRIFNLLGQEIRSFALAPVAPGRFVIEWDGRDALGIPVPNGIYFCRLEARGVSIWRKVYRLR